MKIDLNNFSCLQWNCRSIISNLSELLQFVETYSYSILALQSLNTSKHKLPKIPNYFYPPLFSLNKTSDKVQTALYVRTDLNYSSIQPCPISVATTDPNFYWSGASVKINPDFVLNIISIYYPTGPVDDNTDWLKHLNIEGSKWLIMGDFNAHAPFWEKECSFVSSNRLIENIVDSKLYMLNDGSFTRIPDISTHRPTAIDLSFISPQVAVNTSWCVGDDSLGSDHLPITIKINESIVSENYTEDRIPKFYYKQANWEDYKKHLNSCDISTFEHLHTEEFYQKLTFNILQAADLSIPKCKCKKKGKFAGNVWWNEECKQYVSIKKAKFKQWLKEKSEVNHNEMKHAKINCNRVIAKAKKSYWSNFCNEQISDSKDMHKIWKKLKEFKNGFTLQSYPVKLEENPFPSPIQKSEAFAKIFANNSLSDNLDPSCKHYRIAEENKPEYEDPIPDNNHYINSPITYEEFIDALNSFSCNTSAVGSDGLSYQLLINLPLKWKKLLHSFFQECWSKETLPSIWKESIVIPILKQRKPKSAIDSYRPIALTSHACKVFEKIILKRVLYFCDKNSIIPNIQAGFRKGRCTTDHLVKLSSHIKKQFARRKSILATFFDVKKAYDRVWHARLLYKLKCIGISGNMYSYIKNFLSKRVICTKVENTYSSFKKVDMGIPQGSIIAPLLFNIIISDLSKALSKNTNVVQYADDIAIWINTSLRKNTNKRVVNYVQDLYQLEINNLNNFMKINGLELSNEKTCLMLFNNGKNPNYLPDITLNGKRLEYQNSVKFLGVFFTPKLNWKVHIEYLITKAIKRLNFMKIVSSQHWSQDTKILLHLVVSLVRSKLTYGQEVYFSAPSYLLNKLQSIDSKAVKIALGVPVHSNTINTYREAGILPLLEHRKLSVSKFVVRSLTTPNSLRDELFINSDIHYPKRARDIHNIMPINNFVSGLISHCEINLSCVAMEPICSKIPDWEHISANFDIDFSSTTKQENPNILKSEYHNHVDKKFKYHLKIFTDGSVLDTADAGCGFVIPDLKIHKAYYLGKHYSIFTAELYAIRMALISIMESALDIFNVLLCVDSKAVLHVLRNSDCRFRKDLVFEIKALIHSISSTGIGVQFCWVPSHCGIYWNEYADELAKQGALRVNCEFHNSLHFSKNELLSRLDNLVNRDFFQKFPTIINASRKISRLVYKLRLNSWNTKFSKNVVCACSSIISIEHIIFDCPILTALYQENNVIIDRNESVYNIVHSPSIFDIIVVILKCPIGRLL